MAHAKKRSPKRTQRTASSRSPKPSKPTAPIAVSVPVDRALKSAWEKQSKIIAQASRDDARALDAKYEAVALIAEHNPPLYLAGGYATFDAFVKDHLHEEVRQVRDWMQVATHASPEEETLFSFTRLALLLSLLRAKSKDGTLPKSIDWKSLKVTVQPAKGKPVLKKAIDCTMDEIRAARRAAIDAKTGSPTNHREPAEVTAVREQFSTRTLSAIKIRFNDGVFSFSNVAGFALHEFADALKLAEWESAKPKKTTGTKGKR